MFGAIAGALGMAGADFIGAKYGSDLAARRAGDAQNFSATQAAIQRDWEERMSNTAHQREVADLKAAGLNPMLSLDKGASTPSVSAPQGVQAPVVTPNLGGIVSTAGDLMRTMAGVKASLASADASEAQARATRARANLDEKQGPEANVVNKFWSFIDRLTDRLQRSNAKEAPVEYQEPKSGSLYVPQLPSNYGGGPYGE